MEQQIAKHEIAGAVTMVVAKDRVLHLEATGLADVASKRPMTPETLFWIASMTKPVTGVALLMLQDEGKLSVTDPVAKYLPEFASLKTPSGKPANLTITQLATHTSGLGEAGPDAQKAKTLADLVPLWLAAPMQYEPGAQWRYTQSGINALSRIVEVVSGMTFDAFVQKRIFDPLGMKSTTFYPDASQRARLVTAYAKNKETGVLEPVPPRTDYGHARSPAARQRRALLDGARLREVLPHALERRHARRTAVSEPGGDEAADDAADRRAADRLPPERDLRESRSQLRLGDHDVDPAHAARRRGGDALARHLRSRRRLGHAGLDRSGEGRRLHHDDPAFGPRQQRRQRQRVRRSSRRPPRRWRAAERDRDTDAATEAADQRGGRAAASHFTSRSAVSAPRSARATSPVAAGTPRRSR